MRDVDLPPGLRVLVLGRTHQPVAGHWERIVAFTQALGRWLMSPGDPPVVLITGCHTGSQFADQGVVDGARDALSDADIEACGQWPHGAGYVA